ncbi:ferritin-like domain-containing protein [Pendulispora rubella]|uniref:Ferritin-like domain-containing protein n=1 Tax=Pendulispora rubella TaxID=2741070 RepID=A0ABZ2LIC1_9BACT
MRTTHSVASLRKLFFSVVSPIPVLAMVACSSDNDEPAGIDRSGLSETACVSRERPLEKVKAGNAADYLALRTQLYRSEPGGPVPSGEPTTYSSVGTACSSAANQAKCLKDLADLRPAIVPGKLGPGIPGPSLSYLVYTRRDEVGAVVSNEEFSAFLRPVADLDTAAFLVHRNGYDLACEDTQHNARVSDDGFDVLARKGDGCGKGHDITENLLHVDKDGKIAVRASVVVEPADPQCTYGRKPEGFEPAGAVEEASPLGRFFAIAAELEAASVPAFVRLAEELAHHGAPAQLVDDARSAARDEIRHTAMMTSLARRFGAEPSTPDVPQRPVRGLFEIALENAVEGCVHETYAALQATHQARHAEDRRIRKVMERIAEDETRHGALAWNVASWIEPRLSGEERALIDRARRGAAASLMNTAAEPHPDVVHVAGAPSAAQASRLLHAVAGELWAA